MLYVTLRTYSPVKLTPFDRIVVPPVKDDKLPEKFPASLDTIDFFKGDGEEIVIGVDVEEEEGRGVEEEEEEDDTFKL